MIVRPDRGRRQDTAVDSERHAALAVIDRLVNTPDRDAAKGRAVQVRAGRIVPTIDADARPRHAPALTAQAIEREPDRVPGLVLDQRHVAIGRRSGRGGDRDRRPGPVRSLRVVADIENHRAGAAGEIERLTGIHGENRAGATVIDRLHELPTAHPAHRCQLTSSEADGSSVNPAASRRAPRTEVRPKRRTSLAKSRLRRKPGSRPRACSALPISRRQARRPCRTRHKKPSCQPARVGLEAEARNRGRGRTTNEDCERSDHERDDPQRANQQAHQSDDSPECLPFGAPRLVGSPSSANKPAAARDPSNRTSDSSVRAKAVTSSARGAPAHDAEGPQCCWSCHGSPPRLLLDTSSQHVVGLMHARERKRVSTVSSSVVYDHYAAAVTDGPATGRAGTSRRCRDARRRR